MNDKDFEDGAAALLAHRAALRACAAAAPREPLRTAADVLGASRMPADTREAYALQDALIRLVGEVAGWKVGGARAPEPNCAPVFAECCWADAAPLPFAIASDTEFECEIAYTFSRDLPARDRPYTEHEVAAAIGATRAAVEILAPRFVAATGPAERLAYLADGLGCGGLILGEPVPGYREVDCAAQPVRLSIDGTVVIEQSGGNVASRLMPLVHWLANHLAGRGLPLCAGQTVTTGSWTGARAWGSARHAAAHFSGIGQVHMRAP